MEDCRVDPVSSELAGSCKYGDAPAGSGAMKLLSQLYGYNNIYFSTLEWKRNCQENE